MAAFVGCKAIVFLTVFCFASLLHAQDPLRQNPDPSSATLERVYDSAKLHAEIRRSGVGSIDHDKAVSAVEETTPFECSYANDCEFHQYDDNYNRDNIIGITKYCNCPQGTTCTLAGDNMEQRFLYYRCLSTATESTTEPISRDHDDIERASEAPLSSGTERAETLADVDRENTTGPIRRDHGDLERPSEAPLSSGTERAETLADVERENTTGTIRRDHGDIERASEAPLSTGTERAETPSGVDPSTTERDTTVNPVARSANARSLRKLQNRVGDVKEHAEL